jgi:hypothetical protein
MARIGVRVNGAKTCLPNLNVRPHLFVGLGLIAIFWSASWGHWGILGEYAFFPLWLGYILAVDGLVAMRRGDSLLITRPGHFVLLFILSAPVWWLFESGNNYTQNWHYVVDKDYGRLHVILESSIDFSTVVPAVLETTMLVLSFGFVGGLERTGFRVTISHTALWSLMYAGALLYLGLMLLPTLAFPVLWLWLFLLTDPLNWMRGRMSLLEQFSRGDFHLIAALTLGVLVCGFFWELWNFYAMPKWYYTVPNVGSFKVFEMPILGYLGYIPFAWELYALYHYVFGLIGVRTLL